MTGIEETIKAYILTEFLPGEEPGRLTATTPLVSNGILDSLATLKVVAFLEQEFAISIGAHEADTDNLDSIERIANMVRSKL